MPAIIRTEGVQAKGARLEGPHWRGRIEGDGLVMSLFKQLEKVRKAHHRVAIHRSELATPAAALLARGHRHPLTTVAAAAGAGFALGSFGVGALRVPGMASMLSRGFADIVAHGTRLIAELGMDDSNNDNDSSDT